MYNLARSSCCVEIIGLQLHLHIGAETLSGILQMTYRKNRDPYMVKGSNMIVCVLLVSNSRGCCLAAPGDHEGAALRETWIYVEFSNDIWVKWFKKIRSIATDGYIIYIILSDCYPGDWVECVFICSLFRREPILWRHRRQLECLTLSSGLLHWDKEIKPLVNEDKE